MSAQLALMALLLFKHWLADFPWQSQWMVREKGKMSVALSVHCIVHMVCSFVAIVAFSWCTGVWFEARVLAGLLVAEFYVHAVIDAIKVHPRWGGRWKLPNPRFCTALGADQLAHHLTYIAMVAYLFR